MHGDGQCGANQTPLSFAVNRCESFAASCLPWVVRSKSLTVSLLQWVSLAMSRLQSLTVAFSESLCEMLSTTVSRCSIPMHYRSPLESLRNGAKTRLKMRNFCIHFKRSSSRVENEFSTVVRFVGQPNAFEFRCIRIQLDEFGGILNVFGCIWMHLPSIQLEAFGCQHPLANSFPNCILSTGGREHCRILMPMNFIVVWTWISSILLVPTNLLQ